MARTTAADGKELYRAVITTTVERDGVRIRHVTEHFGPYNSPAPACGMLTSKKREAESRNNYSAFYMGNGDRPLTVSTVVGHVERAESVWTDIDAPVEPTMTLSQRAYDDFVDDARKFRALESAGVDNWTGYDYAMEMLREDEP